MLNPEKKLADYVAQLELLAKEFIEGALEWYLPSRRAAHYRQIVLECHDLLGQLFGKGNFYAANLMKAANDGVSSEGGPSFAGLQDVVAVLRAAITKLGQQHPEEAELRAIDVLRVIGANPREPGRRVEPSGPQLTEITGLGAADVNEAVARLEDAGLAEARQAIGTVPYDFLTVSITPRGRYELQRLAGATVGTAPSAAAVATAIHDALLPPTPVGSPYGFRDEDWEHVSAQRSDPSRLHVVLGHQFGSTHFDTAKLKANIEAMLRTAVESYAIQPGALAFTLHFKALSAGYGEHLFNEIARDIIGADIAIFETSDLNPNVMLELGVALTWGVRVLPIKLEGRPKPPSDVSGQTWADYRDSASEFADPDHQVKLIAMLERAIRKKTSRGRVA